jgi:hydrogenase maturation protease
MKVAVLGIGNILLKDEGIGVKVVQTIMNNYSFPPNVQVIDGGTLGPCLLHYIQGFDEIIVIDAVQGGQAPGTLYRFTSEQGFLEMSGKLSSHQMGIAEVLSQIKLLGEAPVVTFIGVEPQDISPWGMELSPVVKGLVPSLITLVINELEQRGIAVTQSAPASGLKNAGRRVLQ